MRNLSLLLAVSNRLLRSESRFISPNNIGPLLVSRCWLAAAEHAVSHQIARSLTTMSSKDSSSADLSNSDTTSTRENILAKSWTTVASGYEQIFVPRFAAWTDDALEALRTALNDANRSSDIDSDHDDDKPSKALVLCCGPGQELVPVAKILGPTAQVIGVDLAPGMVEAARRRVEAECQGGADAEAKNYQRNISVQVGDAMKPPAGPYRAIFSAFGLQQMPKPIGAVKKLIKALEPNGVAVIIYWPPDAPSIEGEGNGPFELWGDLLKKKLGKDDSKEEAPWDANIGNTASEAGADVLDDKFIVHDITWENAQALFDGMSRAGPWHAMRLRRGDDFVDELGYELQAAYPSGEPLSHKFTARMLVLRRRST